MFDSVFEIWLERRTSGNGMYITVNGVKYLVNSSSRITMKRPHFLATLFNRVLGCIFRYIHCRVAWKFVSEPAGNRSAFHMRRVQGS